MSTFIFLLLVFLLLLAFYFFQRWRDMSILKRNGIPGPRPNLITGNLFDLSRSPHVLKFDEYFRKYGPIVGYYIGKKPTVLLNDIELIRRVQIKDFSNFTDRHHLGIKYGLNPNPRYYTNLVTAQGSQWKELRTLLNPTFSAVKLKAMTPIMSSCIDILMGKIEVKSSKGEEFDLYEAFQLLTTDVIAKCSLGIDTDVQNNPDDEFFQAAKRLFDVKPSRFRLMFTCFPELDRILYPLRRGLQMITEWQNKSHQHTIAKLIQAAIKLRSLGGVSSSNGKKNDLLQLMLDARMSDEEISNTKASTLTINDEASEDEDETNGKTSRNSGNQQQQNKQLKGLSTDIVVATAILFYEAGYETTSTTLGFLAHVLVSNPEIQERVREEVVKLYEAEEGVFDYNTVNKLSYMSQVINETMRYYPPVTTFMTRTSKKDYHYKDIVIPANSTVRIPINQIHHREDLWPEHDKFDPERFSPERKSTIDPIVYQPFGTGPRNCIGMRFALLEIKLTIARLLFRYRLVPGPSTEPFQDLTVQYKNITQTPKNGVWVVAVPL